MSITTDIANFKAANNTNITTKGTPNSIPPFVVGGEFNDLADIVETYYGQKFNVLTGTGVPNDANGADTDLYFRNNNPIEVYQKNGGAWGAPKATLGLGIIFPNGPIIGLQTFIEGFIATVNAGGWVINNTIYRKDIATQFTLSAANLNFGRYDLIYGTTSNTVLILEGTPSSTPVIPTLPANSTRIDVAFIPASSTGQMPYLLYGNNTGSSSIPLLVSGTIDVNGEFNMSGYATGSFPVVNVYVGGIQSPIQYDNTNKKLIGGSPGDTFVARFTT